MKMSSRKVCCGVCLLVAILLLYCIFMPEHSMWLREGVMSIVDRIKDFFMGIYSKIRGMIG